jgi:glycosyl transferase family 25
MKTNAIGGSESAVAYLANNLDKQYEIYIVGDVEEEKYDNVNYVSIANAIGLFKREAFKTIIVSRYISFYQIFQHFSAYETYIWAHDTELIGYGTSMSTEQILSKFSNEITGCVCQTEWHKNLFASRYPALKDRILTINNGINTELFPLQSQKIKNRFLYSSCGERGLSTLLQLWPEIVSKLPDAELFISSYNEFPKNEEERRMEKIIQENSSSIKHLGRLSQPELYSLMSTVEYWLYTNCFLETSCITSLEMLASNVICLYYPIAGLNDTIGEYGIKVYQGSEIKELLLLVEDEERKKSLKARGKDYAMSCSWKNRASNWNQLVIKQQKKQNKIAIFNSFPFHYEMFGFILYYAELNKYSVDIYTNTDHNLGWLSFYRSRFTSLKILPCSNFEKKYKEGEYNFIFVTTDDDNGFQNKWITERVICIKHFFRPRNVNYLNYFNIANFIESKPDSSALTCYPLLQLKKAESSNNTVTILGGAHNFYELETGVINRLRSRNLNPVTLNFIGRNITAEHFKNVNKDLFHINIMPNIETKELIEHLEVSSSYILINYVKSEDRHSGKSIAGSLPLALSALCIPILSKETNKQLKIKNCLEFDDDSAEPIYLLEEIDMESLEKERQQNIDIFHSYMKQVERKHKIYVVHYEKLTERKTHIMKQFEEQGITNFEFISLDRDDQDLDVSLFEDKYSRTQIAIALSHMKAYKDIASSNLAYGIILEDDVLLCPNFLIKLKNYIEQLPLNYGAVFLGEGCGIKEHRVPPERLQPNQNIYLMEQFNKTKCTDSYVLSLQCAKNIVDYLTKMEQKINEPIDWWLNKPLREITNTDVYWCEPTLAKQGTITGLFQSSYQNQ